jgi:hypothetical protein
MPVDTLPIDSDESVWAPGVLNLQQPLFGPWKEEKYHYSIDSI